MKNYSIASALSHMHSMMRYATSRKDGTPAYLHPIRVALNVARLGCDEDTVIVAVLHDLVEDTNTTHKDLEDFYSKEIADLVIALSHTPEESVQTTIDRVRNGGEKAIIVKLCDNCDNIRTIECFEKGKQKTYLHYAGRIQDLGEEMLGKDHPAVQYHAECLKNATETVSSAQ